MRPDAGSRRLIVCAASVLLAGCVATDPAPRTGNTVTTTRIVLIGGAPSEGPGRHAYPDGVRALKTMLDTSPDRPAGVSVTAYPDGWPAAADAFDGVSTIVWWFDGDARHPLRDATRRAQFEALMRRGVGLVALHQASTVPVGEDLGLAHWLGGARHGTFDRTTQTATLVPTDHPVTRGVPTFTYRDEFYPTIRFADDAARVRPVLRGTLDVQYRDGRALVVETPEDHAVAWVDERDDGGRSFAFTGAHFLAALDDPSVRTMILDAIFWTARLDVPSQGVRSTSLALASRIDPSPPATRIARDTTTFHADAGRSGWFDHETVLSPRVVQDPGFGPVWESPPLDRVDGETPRLYASPLYVDRVVIRDGPLRGVAFPTVFAASNLGFVYAIAAAPTGDVAAGRILWRTRLGAPCRLQPAPLDGIPTGILATPVIDVARQRLYVTHCDPEHRWQAYALDLGSGRVLDGWPVRLDEETFNAVNANAGPTRVPPTRRYDFRVQRGALNLSPDGGFLYVTFGETETGWLVAVDTARARVRSAFATVAMPRRGSGGLWGAAGATVDGAGNVYVATGTGYDGYAERDHDWTQSVLKLAPPDVTSGVTSDSGFVLRGTYTPFNHCRTAKNDIDLGSGGIALLPSSPPLSSPPLSSLPSSPPSPPPSSSLMTLGGKQGNVVLLDRDRLPGRLDRRPACSDDPSTDGSLLAPGSQPQFGVRGPLNVFGPYSETDAALDLARGRSVPATWRDAHGVEQIVVTGNARAAEGSDVPVPPSVVRLSVVRRNGAPPHLAIARTQRTLVLRNPGSPVVTSDGPRDALVWVLDENAGRSASLAGRDAPRPVLRALDAETLDVLWESAPDALFTSGKYNEPAFGGGRVYVGTDRIQAFGPGRRDVASMRIAANDADGAVAAAASASVSDTRDAATLFRARCSACHDHPEGNVPPRAVLASRPHERIVDALVRGVMRPYAQGLSREQVDGLARYLRS